MHQICLKAAIAGSGSFGKGLNQASARMLAEGDNKSPSSVLPELQKFTECILTAEDGTRLYRAASSCRLCHCRVYCTQPLLPAVTFMHGLRRPAGCEHELHRACNADSHLSTQACSCPRQSTSQLQLCDDFTQAKEVMRHLMQRMIMKVSYIINNMLAQDITSSLSLCNSPVLSQLIQRLHVVMPVMNALHQSH